MQSVATPFSIVKKYFLLLVCELITFVISLSPLACRLDLPYIYIIHSLANEVGQVFT